MDTWVGAEKGATNFGASLDEKVWAANDGDVVGPEKGDGGYYLVLVSGNRQGDLSFDDVKAELAESLFKEDRAKEIAQKARAFAVDVSSKKGKTLLTQFPPLTDGEIQAGKTQDVRVEETGLMARRGVQVGSIGRSGELAEQAFSAGADAPVIGPLRLVGVSWSHVSRKGKMPIWPHLPRLLRT